MKVQHYLGGIEGLGPVKVEKRVFVEPWEAQLFAVHSTMMGTGIWAWPDLRVLAEGMNPLDYFKYRYYIKWLGGICKFLVDRGYLSQSEIEEKTKYFLNNPTAALPNAGNAEITQRVVDYFYRGANPYRDVVTNPVFKAGDMVRVKDMPPAVHTRLPGYLRNKVGTVDVVYKGAYLYADNVPTDGIGTAQPVYLVKFKTRDIWSDIPDTQDVLYNDFFEAYLEAA
ncbi:nitrile hydratase subunit beta [Kaistia dalseonensis]|uniref:nitrile hydratase n=1 Tax=Kaistia dalseonensis TaxID=410840 RepID=A0ABU0H8Z7_9HYPH|nr:nitrile hydratase subunit beta [Kaistia dalseonensis]MCX5495627.1 nitrile hydratase subunit beta [Kaistia dalseonensis]MDQ0438220.1 nitrile hydratase [Kaistia dalseonensis]